MVREARATDNLLQLGRQTMTGRTGQTETAARDRAAGLREGRRAAFFMAVPLERSDSCGARGSPLLLLRFTVRGKTPCRKALPTAPYKRGCPFLF